MINKSRRTKLRNVKIWVKESFYEQKGIHFSVSIFQKLNKPSISPNWKPWLKQKSMRFIAAITCSTFVGEYSSWCFWSWSRNHLILDKGGLYTGASRDLAFWCIKWETQQKKRAKIVVTRAKHVQIYELKSQLGIHPLNWHLFYVWAILRKFYSQVLILMSFYILSLCHMCVENRCDWVPKVAKLCVRIVPAV